MVYENDLPNIQKAEWKWLKFYEELSHLVVYRRKNTGKIIPDYFYAPCK